MTSTRRQRDEGEGQQERREDQQPFAAGGGASALQQRRNGEREPAEPAHERKTANESRRVWHLAFPKLTVWPGERPKSLADDHHARRTGHTAEPRKRRGSIRPRQNVLDLMRLHRPQGSRVWGPVPSPICRFVYQ